MKRVEPHKEDRMCPACARGEHEEHSVDYLHDFHVTLCRCGECVELPFKGDVLAAQKKLRKVSKG